MPQSLASIVLHVIFSTKNRQPILSTEIRQELHPYIAVVLHEIDCPPLQVGGAADHVHALFFLARTLTVASIIESIKTSSSKWMKTKGRQFEHFRWQAGFGVFSVSRSNADSVAAYICNQDEHHRKITFQEEYRQFLERHRQNCDERYMWD
jgi:putative transposase